MVQHYPPDPPARRDGNTGTTARTYTLTPAGHAALREYRAKLAADAPGDWRRIYDMIGNVQYVRIEREAQA